MHFVDVSSEAHFGLVAGVAKVTVDLGSLVKLLLVVSVVCVVCKEIFCKSSSRCAAAQKCRGQHGKRLPAGID